MTPKATIFYETSAKSLLTMAIGSCDEYISKWHAAAPAMLVKSKSAAAPGVAAIPCVRVDHYLIG
jgi:hypothetical protein